MITMMFVMDCLHFANYFVPLIYNSGALTISAESWAAANCILQKIHRCRSNSAEAQKIGFASSTRTHRSQRKQDDAMQRINTDIRRGFIYTHNTVGNKWECERAAGGVRVSSPPGSSGFWCCTHSRREPPLQPLVSPCRVGPPHSENKCPKHDKLSHERHYFTTCISRKQA